MKSTRNKSAQMLAMIRVLEKNTKTRAKATKQSAPYLDKTPFENSKTTKLAVYMSYNRKRREPQGLPAEPGNASQPDSTPRNAQRSRPTQCQSVPLACLLSSWLSRVSPGCADMATTSFPRPLSRRCDFWTGSTMSTFRRDALWGDGRNARPSGAGCSHRRSTVGSWGESRAAAAGNGR